MPRIQENDAFALARGIDTMDEAQRPQALDILARYKQQQEDLGEPEWPSQARARQDADNRLRGFFDDLKTVDAAAPSLAAVLPYSQNPDEDRARVANTAYLASRYGKTPDEIGASYELWRDDYATRFLQAPTGLGDLAFHSAAAKEIQRTKQKEDTEAEGVKAALRGDDVIPALQAWQAKNLDRMTDSTEFTRGFLQARERAGEHLEFADSLLKQIESNTGLTKGDGSQRPSPASRESAAQFEESLATLAMMKPRDRKQVYAIIGAKAESAGYDQKGFWAQMLSELGRGTFRMGSTITTQAGVTGDVIANFPGMLTNTMRPEEFAATDASIARRQGIGEMYDEVAAIVAGGVDPVKPVISWMNDSVEKGLIKGPGAIAPFMMASAALGPYGAGVMFTADFAEQNRRELRAGGMDNEQAMKIGFAAAPLQAVTESLSNALQLGRFQAVQRVLSSFTKPIGGGAGLVTRYLQNAGVSLTTEFTEEQLQDNVIIPATQQILGALQSDVPDVDWSMYRTRAIESTPELLSVLAPMALVFGGTMTAAQANLSAAVISSQDMLEAAGFSAAQANEVRIQTTEEAKISKAREFWSARAGTPQTIEAAAKTVGERMRMLQGDAVAAQKDLESRGILPRMLHASEGTWKLTFNDGSTADFNSHGEADAARWQWATDQLGKVHMATRSALAQLESGAEVGREFAVEFKPDAMTAKQAIDEGRVDPAQIERRVQQGEAVGESVNEAEAFDNAVATDKATSDYLASLQILGSSVNQFKDGILRTTIRLYEGANVLTLVEEKLEGDAKQIVASKPGRAWMLSKLREYERISGDSLFRDVADDSELQNDDLIEAWSSLGQSYLVGKSKKGAAIGKGGARRIFADVLKAGMGGALNAETQFFNAVWRRAAKLSKLKREGKLGDDLTAELERQLGIDSQAKLEREAAIEAEAIANEALNVGGPSYSEENPGPNGETFSLAPVAPSGIKRAAGDERRILAPVVFDIYRKSYGDIGMQFSSAEDLLKEPETWDVASNADGVPVAVFAWKSTPHGFKLSFTGTDRSDSGKAEWKRLFKEYLSREGYFAELSDAPEHIARKMGVPVIPAEDAKAILGKPVVLSADGEHYERMITGLPTPHVKAMFGVVWKTTKQSDSSGQGLSSLDSVTTSGKKSATPSSNERSASSTPTGSASSFSLRKFFPTASVAAQAADVAHGRKWGDASAPLKSFLQKGMQPGSGPVTKGQGAGVFFQRPKSFDFASVYQAAMVGQSSSMLPLDRLYDEAKKQNPQLTEAEFGARIQALYHNGELLLEPGESPDAMKAALAKYGVRDSLGIPAMFARPMESWNQAVDDLANQAQSLGVTFSISAAKQRIAKDQWLENRMLGWLSAVHPVRFGLAADIRSVEVPNLGDSSVEEWLSGLREYLAGRAELGHLSAKELERDANFFPIYRPDWKTKHQEFKDALSLFLPSVLQVGLEKFQQLEEYDRRSGDLPDSSGSASAPEAGQSFEAGSRSLQGDTFSIRPGDFASRMSAAFSPFQRNPELRAAVAQVAKQRAQRLGAEWIEKAAVLRSARDIGKEQRMREALGFDERLNTYLSSLNEGARLTLEQEPDGLENDPLISAMLDHGKLMSFTTAKKLGKVKAKAGDYDGAPWLPPAWYSKGGGIMPDVMAQAMHDAGLLKDAYVDTLWSELQSRIAAHAKNREAYQKAQADYKAAQKAARADAKAEAEAWANQARAKAGSPKAQRDMLKAALRTLDGILSAAPPEVRARVGGYVKLAGLATDEAMLDEIERRVEKLDVELEKWLKKEGISQLEKLLKKGRPDMAAGKKGKGKDADTHHLFAAAERAAKMDDVAVAGELARLDALIAGDTLTPEQEALAITERGIVELVGDLYPRTQAAGKTGKNGQPLFTTIYDGADSGRIFSAIDTLRSIYDGAWLKWKLAEIERKERRAGMRQDFIDDTGKQGLKPERDAADKAAVSLLGKIKGGFLSLSSFHEVLSYAFGEKSERVTSLVNAEREASGQYEDANQTLADEVEELFTDMSGGSVLAGERLRFDMAQRTIKTAKGELSQLEVIQALLMWRQEDGRRHMEGQFDENGKPVGKWHYDQTWIDEITKALTPEARRLMSWIMQKYGAEHAVLNPLYRARYGVNMPAHDNYAPITVAPMQTKAGEVVDPVTGAATSSGSILTPGSLRTRSRSAIAEPQFRDALQTLLIHTRQLEYWKAYYDLAVEANAVLGNREVMNAVHAKGGEQASSALRKWVDAIAQGGFRDASASLEMNKMLQRMTGRAASVGLLGRFSTLLVQSTQLAAASVKMPLGAYLRGMSKLLTGNLGYRDAIRSPFIQRRFKSAPPIVRQVMESLGAASRPNQIKRATRALGQLLSGTDALFTAGTYALLLDYHRGTGRALGLTGVELEEHAHAEAERDTEQVAQPTRMAARSLAEITSTNPLAKVSWAYASEARQKIALMAWATMQAKAKPAQFAKTAFLVFGVGGLLTQVLKGLWREAKGDDDEKKWSAERLTLAALTGPLHGVPLASELMGDQGMLSGVAWAWPAIKDVASGEADMRDVDTILSTLGLFNDTAAAVSSLAHAGLDAAKVLENLVSKK